MTYLFSVSIAILLAPAVAQIIRAAARESWPMLLGAGALLAAAISLIKLLWRI